MALDGIRDGGSPLDRFQQVRDLAKRKLDAEDGRAKLADMLRRKQEQLGKGLAPDRPQAASASRSFSPPPAAGGLAAYGRTGRAGAQDRPDPRPGLGRHIDLTA